MGSGNEPVDCGVHESEDGRQCVKHGEVKLLSKAGHVTREGHELDEEPFNTALVILRIRVVEVSECPGLRTCQLAHTEVESLNIRR